MKTHTLEHNTGSFSIPEELTIKIDAQDMVAMGWSIGEDSGEDLYKLKIDEKQIRGSILASNNEYSDVEFTFNYISAIQDLIRWGHLMIADEEGNETENGTLQIKP